MSQFNWSELRSRLNASELLLKQAFEGHSRGQGEILRKRAQSLAMRNPQTPQKTTHYLKFLVAGQFYALPLSVLAGVFPLQKWTPLPESPPQLLGLVSYRGSVLPLLAFDRLLDQASSSGPGFALILRSQSVACRVDRLGDVVSLSDDQVKPLDRPGLLVQGMGPDGTTILSLQRLSEHPYFRYAKEDRS